MEFKLKSTEWNTVISRMGVNCRLGHENCEKYRNFFFKIFTKRNFLKKIKKF
jgi:hypothetical protein